jgi:hypothetical protein
MSLGDFVRVRVSSVADVTFLQMTTNPVFSGFCWLTVAPKGQPELEIILMKVGSGSTFMADEGRQRRKELTPETSKQ